jgi:hypothetical protein
MSFDTPVLSEFVNDLFELVSAVSKSHAENIHQAVLADSFVVQTAIQEEIKTTIFSPDYSDDLSLI